MTASATPERIVIPEVDAIALCYEPGCGWRRHIWTRDRVAALERLTERHARQTGHAVMCRVERTRTIQWTVRGDVVVHDD